jgi:hypothetical protein
VCGHRRRHRSGRHRRRAGVGLPLLLPRLPDPAAPRGRGHVPGRPDRVRLAGPAPGGPRRHRVDPARRHPGPALPRRGRAATRPRCSTPSSPAGCSATPASAWPRWSRACSAPGSPRSTPRSTGRPGRCPSRGWSTPPSTSRCSSSCATLLGAELVEAGKDEWARQEFEHLRGFEQSPGSTRGAVRRAAPGPRPPRPRRGAGAVGDARRDRRAARRHPGPDHPRLGDRGRRAGDADRQGRAAGDQGLPRPRRRAVRRPLGRRAARGRRDGRGGPADPVPALRRPAAPARLGREGPGRRPAARAGPRGDHRAGRGAQPPGREPAHPRLPAPGAVDPARRTRDPEPLARRSSPSSWPARRPAVAGRLAGPVLADAILAADRARTRARGRAGPIPDPEPAADGSDPAASPEPLRRARDSRPTRVEHRAGGLVDLLGERSRSGTATPYSELVEAADTASSSSSEGVEQRREVHRADAVVEHVAWSGSRPGWRNASESATSRLAGAR